MTAPPPTRRISLPARAPAASPDGTAGPSSDRVLGIGYLAVLVLSCLFSVPWLAIGMVVALAAYSPGLHADLEASAATGSEWAQGVLAAAAHAEPFGQAVLDYAFSTLSLALAVVLLVRAHGGWVGRLLALAMVGSAGAFNLQAHGATLVVEKAVGVAIGQAHQIQLHGIACAAYIMALLLFPTGHWRLDPTGGPRSALVALPAVVTLLVVGVGTALLPHTVSCILFFGFGVPLVGLAALQRRKSQSPSTESRTQSRLLFSALVGAFSTIVVLGLITLVLVFLHQPGLTLVDPTAKGSTAQPTAVLFWFSRLAAVAVAAAALVATRRGELWMAERVFSRGLASVLVVVLVGGGWVITRASIDRLYGLPTAWASIIATTASSVAFLPLYLRVEQLVERLLYGSRPTPYRVLADVASLSGSRAGGPNLAAVAEAIGRALGARTCQLTVARPGLRDRTYGWDADWGTREWTSSLADVALQADHLVLPISQGDEQIGAISVDRGAVAGLQNERHHLLEDVADSLGAILQASRLGIELERQLRAALAHAEEIAVSRRTAVAEMDNERRGIERDLHDGAQHHLVTLRLALGMVEHEVGSGQLVSARERLGDLSEQLRTAEAVLAKTATGVSSIVLSEQGLVAALRADLASAQPPVPVDGDDGLRFPPEIEAAVYFCCLESVNNARKHAGGAPIAVKVESDDRSLRFTVRDEGPGFVVSTSGSVGRGLRNLASRVTTVGGTVDFDSAPGQGTTVRGRVPLAEPPVRSAPDRAAPPVPTVAAAPEVAAVAAAPEVAAVAAAPEVAAVPVPVPVADAAAGPPPPPSPVVALPPPAPVAPLRPPPRSPEVTAAPLQARPAGPAAESTLLVKVRGVVETAVAHSAGQPDEAELQRLRARLAAPLRVGVVGQAGVGTSTLAAALSAVVPADVAVVDLSDSYDQGDPVDALVVLLRPAGGAAAAVARAGVDPGAVSVLYVLGKADEVCGGQPEDWDEALAVAAGCQRDPDLERTGQPVTPVSGLLALGAVELTDEDVATLRALGADPDEADDEAPLAPLLDRLGWFGVRLAAQLLSEGTVTDRDGLSSELARRSGLTWLGEALGGQFARRAQVLRARAAMLELEEIIRHAPSTAEQVLYQLEQLRIGTHELAELELSDALTDGSMVLIGSDRDAALRLLGTADGRTTARLGLAEDASPSEVRAAITEELTHWRHQAAHPAATSSVRRAAEILARTCESLLPGAMD